MLPATKQLQQQYQQWKKITVTKRMMRVLIKNDSVDDDDGDVEIMINK